MMVDLRMEKPQVHHHLDGQSDIGHPLCLVDHHEVVSCYQVLQFCGGLVLQVHAVIDVVAVERQHASRILGNSLHQGGLAHLARPDQDYGLATIEVVSDVAFYLSIYHYLAILLVMLQRYYYFSNSPNLL